MEGFQDSIFVWAQKASRVAGSSGDAGRGKREHNKTKRIPFPKQHTRYQKYLWTKLDILLFLTAHLSSTAKELEENFDFQLHRRPTRSDTNQGLTQPRAPGISNPWPFTTCKRGAYRRGSYRTYLYKQPRVPSRCSRKGLPMVINAWVHT